jgi:uncharacterized protein
MTTRAPDAGRGGRFAGCGVGLRARHFDEIFDHLDRIDCFEILVENFIGFGGKPRAVLERAAAAVPLVFHGTSLSIGDLAPLSSDYLDRLYAAIARYRPLWFSDHLCFSSAGGVYFHDLLPMPFTEEAAEHVAARARRLQDEAGIPFLLENPSYYVSYGAAEMSEAEFLTRVLERADCGLLLDVNNVYVNSVNHGYDPRAFIDALPCDRVRQIHMAGHERRGEVIIDTHGEAIIDPVYDLYAYTLERTGPVCTIVEWDNTVPALEVLLDQCDRVRARVPAEGR